MLSPALAAVSYTHLDVYKRQVGTVVLHGSTCIIGVSLTNCIVTYFHNILILGHPLIRQFLRKFLRYLFTRTNRQLKLYGNTGIIPVSYTHLTNLNAFPTNGRRITPRQTASSQLSGAK